MLAWALLLSGWLGGGALALVLAPGVAQAQALIAAWPLALAAAAWGLQALQRLGGATHRLLLLIAGAVAALALQQAPHGGGLAVLLSGLAAWAWLAAAAMRGTAARPAGLQAVLGAALAWWVLGDANHSQALAGRLSALAGVAAVWLALRPAPAAASAAGRFDCLLGASAGTGTAALARLSMLAMMCALPLMLQQCRAGGGSAIALLAWHLAAMFGPLLLAGRCAPAIARWLLPLLLATALWPLLGGLFDPGSAMLWVGLAHGLAWSLAGRPGADPRAGSAWPALRQSLLALLIGGVLAAWGPATLLPLQGLIGALSLLCLLRPPARAWRRCSAGARPGADAPGSGARWV